MLPLRFPLSCFATTLLLTSCGGRTNGESPTDQSSETPSSETAPGLKPSSTMGEQQDASTAHVEPSEPTDTLENPNTTSGTSAASASDVPTADAIATEVTPIGGADGGVITSAPVVVDPPAAVCEGQCGNAIVDSCQICDEWRGGGSDTAPGLPLQELAAPPIDPVCTTVSELCDGALAPEQTCEAIGFAGGTLGCSQFCRYDDSACDSCVANDETQACRDDLASGATPNFVALATNSAEVVAAWNEGCKVKVGWFDENLETLQTTTLPEAACVTSTAGITLAPLATSWIVEIGATQFVLDVAGEVVSERDIDGAALFAAPRLGDTPLVVRQVNYQVVTASLLDEWGTEVWTRQLSDQVIEAHYGSATAVSDGFLVALRTDVGVQVFHLDETDGAIVDTSTPGSVNTEYPQLHASNGEVRLVWADFGATPSVHWARLSEQGQRMGDAVQIGSAPDYFNRSPLVVDGEDTVVVLGGYTGGTGIGRATHVRRLDATGATNAGDVAVQADPNLVQWPQVVAYDGSFVTAWVGKGESGRVGLAKIDL